MEEILTRRGRAGTLSGLAEWYRAEGRIVLKDVRNITRPILVVIIAAGGLAFAWDWLSKYDWHHFTPVWVISLAFGLSGAYGVYREVHNRLLVNEWLWLDDGDEARSRLDEVRKAVRTLPPWWHEKYLRKKAALDGRNGRRGGRHFRKGLPVSFVHVGYGKLVSVSVMPTHHQHHRAHHKRAEKEGGEGQAPKRKEVAAGASDTEEEHPEEQEDGDPGYRPRDLRRPGLVG